MILLEKSYLRKDLIQKRLSYIIEGNSSLSSIDGKEMASKSMTSSLRIQLLLFKL